MKLKEIFFPSFLVSESFYPVLFEESNLMALVRQTLDTGHYKRIEISAMKTPEGIQALRSISETVPVTQWITNDLNDQCLNPSSVDAELRHKTADEMKRLVRIAAQSGADRVAFISCADPGPTLRREATMGLAEVMTDVAAEADKYGITLLLEPLDRGAHKNNLIGPTDEAAELIRHVREWQPNVALSWDSAHAALNGENLPQAVEQNMPYIGQIHLANAVLDKNSTQYGDWHMKMGAPGFLTEDAAYEILKAAARQVSAGKTLGVTVERRSPDKQSMAHCVTENYNFLHSLLEREV